MPTVEADRIRCAECGADVRVAPGMVTVKCHHCGNELEVHRELRQVMATSVLLDAVFGIRELRARWSAIFHEQSQAATRPLLAGVAGSVVLGCLWIGALPFRVSLVVAAPLIILTLVSIRAATSSFRASMTLPTLERLRTVRVMRCSGCGGLTASRGGAPVSSCSYCGSSLLVPSETLDALLRDARSLGDATRDRRDTAVQAAYAEGAPLVWPIVLGIVSAVLFGVPGVIIAAYLLRAIVPVRVVALIPIPLLAMIGSGVVVVRSVIGAARARRGLESEIERLARTGVASLAHPDDEDEEDESLV